MRYAMRKDGSAHGTPPGSRAFPARRSFRPLAVGTDATAQTKRRAAEGSSLAGMRSCGSLEKNVSCRGVAARQREDSAGGDAEFGTVHGCGTDFPRTAPTPRLMGLDRVFRLGGVHISHSCQRARGGG